jgi:L-malate glycosyltransferase
VLAVFNNKRKINVLFLLPEINAGGSERIVLELARNLNRSVFNINLAFFNNGALKDSFREVCNEIFHVPKKDGFDPAAVFELSRIVRLKDIHVINAHHYMPFFYSSLGASWSKTVLIYTEHSVPEVEGIYSSKHKFVLDFLLHLKHVSIVGVSEEITNSFNKKFPSHRHKMQCISNGVDIARFNLRVDRDRIRAEWGLSPDQFVIGSVANFRKVKNHRLLVHAFHHLNRLHPHTRLMLVGKGYGYGGQNTEAEVRGLVDSYGLQDRVLFPGHRDDIPRLLQSFDAFCLPSLSEGLPVSILEAMAARVPVVGSEVRGIREVISPGETGLLFRSDDLKSLMDSLQSLIMQPHLSELLKRRAFSYVCKNHGMERWISAHEQLFQIHAGRI